MTTPRDDIAGLSERLAKEMEASLLATFLSPASTSQTALLVRGNVFMSVSVNADGRAIEPCSKCGPLFLCQEHMPS